MELDYRLEADNQRAFAKAYEGDQHFLVPHIVASAPKVVIQEWIDGMAMAEIIRNGTVEQRDLMATRLVEFIFDAPRRLEMVHGDAHPGNFMLLPDNRMGVIDFGAVAPMPGGLPVELGMTIRLARDKNYDKLLPTMEKAGFIQKGQQVSLRDIDEMLRQYVEPVEADVFHYTRKWLQRMTNRQIDRGVAQIRTARQMDIPPKLAIPMRVIASVDGDHVPTGRACADEADRGGAGARFRQARRRPRVSGPSSGSRLKLRRRPCEDVHAAACARRCSRGARISPPHTPHGSSRSSAAARHWRRIGQSAHSTLARSRSAGFSANHKSGSPAWHGKCRQLLLVGDCRADMSVTCFLV